MMSIDSTCHLFKWRAERDGITCNRDEQAGTADKCLGAANAYSTSRTRNTPAVSRSRNVILTYVTTLTGASHLFTRAYNRNALPPRRNNATHTGDDT